MIEKSNILDMKNKFMQVSALQAKIARDYDDIIQLADCLENIAKVEKIELPIKPLEVYDNIISLMSLLTANIDLFKAIIYEMSEETKIFEGDKK